MSKSNLHDGAVRMGRIVRAARERQRSSSGLEDLPLSAMNPADAWARKYLSEGIGPEAPKATGQAPAHELPAQGRQAQFMRELKARAAGKPERTMGGPAAKSAGGKMAMEKPFKPTSQRSGWRGMLRGK